MDEENTLRIHNTRYTLQQLPFAMCSDFTTFLTNKEQYL